MPKHWWEVPALKDVYQLRLDHLRRQMREQFQKDYVKPEHMGTPQGNTGWCDAPDCWCGYVRVGEAVQEAAYIEDAEPPACARDIGDSLDADRI